MRLASLLIGTMLCISVPLLLGGCKSEPGAEGQNENHEEEHGHDHDHDHDHAEGPHGGHMLALTGEGTSYQAEWVHYDSTGEVAVFLLEADGQTPVENPPPEVSIEVTTGNDRQTYTLPAVDVVNDVPAKSAYSIADPTLLTALTLIVEGQEPVLRAAVGENPVSATFEPHDHEHDHDHDH